MPATTPRHRTIFSRPGDFVHRRRFRRKLTNFLLVAFLSALAAYFITRPTGGQGFTLPKAVSQASLAAPPAHQSGVIATNTASASRPMGGGVASPNAPSSGMLPANLMVSGVYMLGKGPHGVNEAPDLVLHDAKRNKDLHVRVFYPTEPGPYPVIIFSHGTGDSPSCCDALTRHWASYGYVTLQPVHEDSSPERQGVGEENVSLRTAVRRVQKDSGLWQSRLQDMTFLLDELAVMQNHFPAVAGKMDPGRIGMGGDSVGADLAGVAGGALIHLPGRSAAGFADPRVKAVLLLSPQGRSGFGLNGDSWAHVAVPLLSLMGSLDAGANKRNKEWREIPFERSQPGDIYQVYIQGVGHRNFLSAKAFLPGQAANGVPVLGYTNSVALAFWDAYLKADPEAKIYLQSSALQNFSHGAVSVSRR